MIEKWSDLNFWRAQRWKDIKSYLSLHQVYYPPRKDIFNALKFTPLKKVKVVILGQDPYANGHANGLAFSVNTKGLETRIEWPPTLKNIFKEYNTDLGFPHPGSGNLTPWAREGVLLLNTVLTVPPGEPNTTNRTHKHIGWQDLTTDIIKTVRTQSHDVVFVLWGREARALAEPLIGDASRVISAHPSPLSAGNGFFGSRPFTKTNALLQAKGLAPINWFLEFSPKLLNS